MSRIHELEHGLQNGSCKNANLLGEERDNIYLRWNLLNSLSSQIWLLQLSHTLQWANCSLDRITTGAQHPALFKVFNKLVALHMYLPMCRKVRQRV